MSGSEIIRRLEGICNMEPNYNAWGIAPITREAVEDIKTTAGDADILLHRMAFLCCDMCGVCPKDRQNPFDCEIIGTGGQS